MAHLRNQAKMTADRSVRFRLDVDDYQAIQVPYALSLLPKDFVYTSSGLLANVEVTKLGLQIAPADLSAISQTSFGNGSVYKAIADGGILQVAPGIKSYLNWRKPTELTGADTDSWIDVSFQGDYFLEKTVSATANWADCNLPADKAAWPDPVNPENFDIPDESDNGSYFQLDRIIVANQTSDGTKQYQFRFALAGNVQASPDYILVFHFAGPRGNTAYDTGTGRYALCLTGDGNAALFEKGFKVTEDGMGEEGWYKRMTFAYSPANQVSGKQHRIDVVPYPYPAPTNNVGGCIVFNVTTGDNAGTNSSSAGTHAFHNVSDPGAFFFPVAIYNAPGTPTPITKPLKAVPCPVRVSARRDIRPQVQISEVNYTLEGYVVLDAFQLIGTPVTAPELIQPIRIDVTAFTPGGGGSVGIALFDVQQGTEDPRIESNPGLTPVEVGTLPGDSGGYATFNPVKGSWQYQARVIISGTSSPVITSVQITMDGVYTTASPGEFTVNSYPTLVTSYNFSGADADPTHATGAIVVSDLGNQYPKLRNRGRFRTIIDTTYTNPSIDWTDPSNDWKRPALFSGIAVSNPAMRHGVDRPNGLGGGNLTPDKVAAFPAHDWQEYKMSLLGDWKRVSESLSPFGWNWSVDPTSGNDGELQPYKVTDALYIALTWAGVPPEMIDIGGPIEGQANTTSDFDIRFYQNASSVDSTTITPGQDILEWAISVARDYLGMALYFDANATRSGPTISDKGKIRGCWRLAHPSVAPFNILADFVTEPGPGMLGNLVHMLSAYPHRVSTQGNTVQTVPIWKGSLTVDPHPPECNFVLVAGQGNVNIAPGANETPDLLMNFDWNPESFDYLGKLTSDPESIDYIGTLVPAYKIDSQQCPTKEAVDFVLRRYSDLTTHGLKFVTFTGPLVLVTDTTDPKQVRPRPLRFQDAVTIDGITYLVRDVDIHFDKDYQQFATYSLQEVTWPYLVPTGAN